MERAGPASTQPGRHPDTLGIYSVDDFAATLDELRRAHGFSLSVLSRHTGIPRSTLHTYLTGRSLPPAWQLDRIVIALGVPENDLRQWAEARERVEAIWRATQSRSPASATARLAADIAELRSGLDHAIRDSHEQTQPLMRSEHVYIGPDRRISRVDITQTVVARTDGARLHVRILMPSNGLQASAVKLRPGVGCQAADTVPQTHGSATAFPIIFDAPLRAGQTHHVEYSLDYSGAWRPLTAESPPPANEVGCLFDAMSPPLEFRVQFSGEHQPCDVRQIYLSHPDGPEERIRDLDLDLELCAHMFVARPCAGCHGIRWAWPA
ncbi:transcriptional regulator with XRE-family HTH domain [Rudaeicoccus suwonensis]|uniref:Transcriptional regulator with XRE-family HTH domain n=2 Tax=Rudaeicoccus suwonensis TaxID=657409 RepID=A0A561E0Z4_9MICO|nr:transcriptional regulator with XRE-family HTH domain [Rudaeicoccus suwonensis]